MKIISKLIIAAGILIAIYLGYRTDFYVWRLQHPQAPAWTYLFSN